MEIHRRVCSLVGQILGVNGVLREEPPEKVLGCSYVTFKELSTILTEIEAVINF